MARFFLDRQKSVVCLIQGKDGNLGPNIEIVGDRQEVSRILPGHVGYTAYLPLAPKQLVVVEHRHMVEMNCIDRHYAALTQTGEGAHDDLSTGSKSDRAV